MKIINMSDLEKAKREIKKSKEKPIIVQAKDDIFNRKITEQGGFEVLLSPETGNRKDSVRQIDSGLNHVLAKIAQKNKVRIGISLDEVRKLSPKEKAKRLSKIKQNINICKKTKTKIAISLEGSSLLLSLGASTSQAKEAVSQSF